MLNNKKFEEALEAYKKAFNENHWKNERYKWAAIKQFQDNWDINAEDFLTMFNRATEGTNNLLASQNYFPKAMLQQFIEADPEAMRVAFINLFDETKPLERRIHKFTSDCEDIRTKYDKGSWHNHYQDLNAITTYLWLKYPDKYYIYKYSLYKEAARLLESEYQPKKGQAPQNVTKGFRFYDELKLKLKDDIELNEIFNGFLDGNCYPDLKGITLTIDFGYFLRKKSPPQGENMIQSTQPQSPAHSAIQYWWLNANPEFWSFAEFAVGEEQSYTRLNKNGQPRRIQRNFDNAKFGDIVILYETSPCKKIVGLALISHTDDKKIVIKKTETLATPIDCTDIKAMPELADMEFFKNPNGSLFKLTEEEYTCIMDAIRKQNSLPQNKNKEEEKYAREDFLSEVYMSEQNYDALRGLLLNKKNIILQGAPGVGKTFAAKRLAYSIMGEKDDDRIEFVQFHQSYSYEDFVMGYRPNKDGFLLKEGVFYRFCRKAESRPNENFFFIIDEINRGNISRIFGELLMLIEKDYRGEKIELTYGGQLFAVPENVYIIGMMNTADRSLALMDYALRRRFSFFEMSPAFESDGFKDYKNRLGCNKFNKLIDSIEKLNDEISNDESLGSGFCIGHSYFCGQSSYSDEWLKQVITYDIIPMLAEYWFDDKEKPKEWKNKLLGVFDD